MLLKDMTVIHSNIIAKKQRLDEFDLMKGFGILLVMLGHAPVSAISHVLIYNVHLPLFFFVSGVFYRQRTLKDQIVHDFEQLIIPYFFFVVVWILVSFVGQIIHSGFSLEVFMNQLVVGINPLDEKAYYLTRAIWFLPCLFIVRLMAFFIFKAKHVGIGILLALVLYIGAYFLNVMKINIPFFIDSAMCATLFYVLGNLFYKTKQLTQKRPWWVMVCLAITYLVVCLVLRPFVNIKTNEFPYFLVFTASLGIFFIYQICLFLANKQNYLVRYVRHAGMISLSLLGLHRPIYFVILPLLSKMLKNDSILAIIMVFITSLLIFCLDYLLSKYAPVLIGKKRK